jgi:hypothetical protein
MTIATGNFAELLWPGIKERWGTAYNDYTPLYTKIFEVKQSTLRFEKEQNVTGLGLAGVKDEGSPAAYQDPFQGFQKEYNNITYALGTTVTREMYEDDQYNYIKEAPDWLARSMRQTEETIAFNHLNRAQNSAFTGADGVTLLNSAHPLVGGGTYSNVLSTPADLTQTSLENGIQDLMDFVDDQSLKIRVTPKCLVVPTALNFTARKLLESDYTVGSADNDVNPVNGLFTDLVVSPYLTDADGWFIISDIPHGLTWYNRRSSEIVRDNEFDTQNLKFLTTSRFSSGFTDSRGVYGSEGAA